MTGLAMEKPTFIREKQDWRPADYGVANAFAKIIRREFAVEGRYGAVSRRFKVTENEARGLVHGTASKRTLDKILRNPRNFAIWLEAICDVSGVTLEQYIEQEARGAAHERERAEAKERHLESLEARWRARIAEPSRVDR